MSQGIEGTILPGPGSSRRMRTILICHENAALDRGVLAPWLASFSNLTGIVVLRESRKRVGKRLKREVKRVGPIRFFDVLLFRAYYKLFMQRDDEVWEEETLRMFQHRHPQLNGIPQINTHSPNSPEAEDFIRSRSPDLMLARCKSLLKESVFSIPVLGTYVMHPGICPEYRNAHGCFWALANRDYEKVGMTLLRIDKGVDTGPVYGYYSYAYNARKESHVRIQHRVVLENLEMLEQKLKEIQDGRASPISTNGRPSGTWGQPWLSKFLYIRAQAGDHKWL